MHFIDNCVWNYTCNVHVYADCLSWSVQGCGQRWETIFHLLIPAKNENPRILSPKIFICQVIPNIICDVLFCRFECLMNMHLVVMTIAFISSEGKRWAVLSIYWITLLFSVSWMAKWLVFSNSHFSMCLLDGRVISFQ